MRDDKFDAILCVAGGWAGGSAASKGEDCCLASPRCLLLPFIPYSLNACVSVSFSLSVEDVIKNCDLVWKQSVWTSVISSHVASKYLKE